MNINQQISRSIFKFLFNVNLDDVCIKVFIKSFYDSGHS